MKASSLIVIISILGIVFLSTDNESDQWENLSSCIADSERHIKQYKITSIEKELNNRKTETLDNLISEKLDKTELYIKVWESAKHDQDFTYNPILIDYDNCLKYSEEVKNTLIFNYKNKIIFLEELYNDISLNEKYINLVQEINQTEKSKILVGNFFKTMSAIEDN